MGHGDTESMGGGERRRYAVGTQLHDMMSPGPTRWRLTVSIISIVSKVSMVSIVYIAESGGKERSGLTRDGTAEPVSRDQFLRCERG